MTAKPEKNEKIISGIAYISWIFFIIAWFVSDKCRTPFVMRHLNQAFNLQIISSILAIIIRAGILSDALASILSLAVLVFLIWGVVNAIRGSEERIPILGAYDLFK